MIPIYAQAVILRCTGPGGIRWQHVAQQLGRSVHAVRCDFDPTYQEHVPPKPLGVPKPPLPPAWPGWTAAKVTDLQRMMSERGENPLSSRQIAAALGAPSADIVLGKVWRMGMVFTQKRRGIDA